MDYIWGASIVETCLQMMIDLWEIRNKEVYGKDKEMKQQKKKAKAAISVQDLHGLQDQARPVDAFLFFIFEELQVPTVIICLGGCGSLGTVGPKFNRTLTERTIMSLCDN